MKTKKGNMTTKEFIKEWGEGIKAVTPLQQTTTQVTSTWVMLIGIIGGVVITIKDFKNYWWLTLILVAALFNTGISQMGLIQKKKMLKKMDDTYDMALIEEKEVGKNV